MNAYSATRADAFRVITWGRGGGACKGWRGATGSWADGDWGICWLEREPREYGRGVTRIWGDIRMCEAGVSNSWNREDRGREKRDWKSGDRGSWHSDSGAEIGG